MTKDSRATSRGWVRPTVVASGRILFLPFLLAAIVAVVLELGLWTQEETFQGPFATETPGSLSVIVPVKAEIPFKCCLRLVSDNVAHPFQSDLKLWINGREMGPAHALHADIRHGSTTAFSFWNGVLLFALPPDVENNAGARATIRFSWRPLDGSAAALLFASAMLSLISFWGPIKAFVELWGETTGNIILLLPLVLLRVLVIAGTVASLLYIGCTIYAFLSGWALPTTALIYWSPIASWAARWEPMLANGLLLCAAIGAVATWLAFLTGSRSRQIRRQEIALMRYFSRWGLFIATCTFIFSISAMWSNTPRLGDLQLNSVGGLVAATDAANYFTGAQDQARDGVWSGPILRRPFAAAFRSVLTFFGDFSYSNMLLLQTVLLSAATCFAASAVARWRGLWAGLAFFALVYVNARNFAPTSLTEPLGIWWALFSVPFFIAALQRNSLGHALIALASMSVALATRMGSMFTIPALIAWMVWQFGRSGKEKVRVLLLSGTILFGIFLISFLLTEIYGDGQILLTGSNFSFVLCGVTMNTDWTGCIPKLRQATGLVDLEGSTKFLYHLAWENFKNHPELFFQRLVFAAKAFLFDLPQTLWSGYNGYVDISSQNFLSVISLIGILFVWTKRRELGEVSFWLVVWASVLASASIVFLDDGRRVLVVTHVLLSLFVAMGYTAPAAMLPIRKQPDAALFRGGVAALAIITLLFLGVPWLAHQLSPTREFARKDLEPGATAHIVFGGHRMTGFLVVSDGAPLLKNVPSMHFSTFVSIFKNSGLDKYFVGLLSSRAPAIPFAFVSSVRVEKGEFSICKYVVPPEVLERRDVTAWKFEGEIHNPGTSALWLDVTRAEPLAE
jgi:hypothetical protein